MENKYDYSKFLERIKDLSYTDMIKTAIRENDLAEASLNGKGSKMAREMGCEQFIADLGGLIFYLQSGTKPFSISDYTFLSYQPLIENLIKKGQMKNTAIDIFIEVRNRLFNGK